MYLLQTGSAVLTYVWRISIRSFILFAVIVYSISVSAYDPVTQNVVEPELPRVFLDTTYAPQTGRTINVTSGGDLQAAINNAKLGDTISLSPGAVFTGNFILTAKPGQGWIVIRPAMPDYGLPPPGKRITPAYSGILPKILSPNADAAIETAHNAHHYRLVGLEIGVTDNVVLNYGIVKLGGNRLQDKLELVPHDLIVDRCYIHGNSTGAISRGVALNGARTAIVDSHISECHEAGADTQAIAGWNGPGPFKIVNNYLEGAAENFMLGGADAAIPGLVPEDIEFRQNHCYKPLRWKADDPSYAGVHWSVKNLFELKNSRRVLIEGNIFENNWVDGQNGFAILFTPRNEEGGSPWSVVEDITFINNIVRHSAGGINILGMDNLHPSQQSKRIKIKNNLLVDIGGAQWGKNGIFLQVTNTPNVLVDHNTVMHTGNIITAYGEPSVNFIFTNNIMQHNEYGVIGDGTNTGNLTLTTYFPALIFTKNVLIGGSSRNYPAGNYFPVSVGEIGFFNVDNAAYALTTASPFTKAGTDGKDLGCDFDELIRMTGQTQVLLSPSRPSRMR